MDWMQFIQTLIGIVLGSAGTVVTLKATRKKANAEAKSTELDNVQEAVKIWRELAEQFKVELDQARKENAGITRQIEELKLEITKLRNVTTRTLKLLDKITPDNLESMKDEIKNEIHATK